MSIEENTYKRRLYIGLDLLRFENICYFELIKQFINIYSIKKKPVIYGNEEGLCAYLSIGLQLDLSVFLYESIKHMNMIFPKEFDAFISAPEFKNLEKVRNNVHTFFKKGNFAKKAEEIIENNLVEYKLKKHDIFFILRNDISLAFEILNHKRQLVGSDYFVQHCLFECNGEQWSGKDYMNYANYLSANIKKIAETTDESVYQLKPLFINKVQPQIELFDYKSDNLFLESELSNVSTFRIMLILFQISYGVMLVEKVLALKSYDSDDLWICFFTKLLSIKYDESIDNLCSMLKYASKDDKTVLKSNLSAFNFDINHLAARDFARNLRNTIHYQNIHYYPQFLSEKTIRDYIITIYLSNSNVETIEEFKDKAQKMFDEMKILQAVIRKVMNVDKKYRY